MFLLHCYRMFLLYCCYQMGLLGGGMDDSDEDDADLEAELRRLEGGGAEAPAKAKKQSRFFGYSIITSHFS